MAGDYAKAARATRAEILLGPCRWLSLLGILEAAVMAACQSSPPDAPLLIAICRTPAKPRGELIGHRDIASRGQTGVRRRRLPSADEITRCRRRRADMICFGALACRFIGFDDAFYLDGSLAERRAD